MTPDGQFERHDMSFTTFLSKVFRGEMGCKNFWSLQYVKDNFIGAFDPKRVQA